MNKAKIVMTAAEAEADRKKWLELRNKGIGGSDAGIVMRMSPFKSRLALWMEKTGKKEIEDLSNNERVYWGIKNEQNIADWFTEKTGKKLRKCGTMQSVEHPWMIANVDRMVVGENAGLEIKTAGVSQYKLWKGDEIPDSYYCQCHHYMMVTGCDKWYIAVLIGGNEGIIKEIPRNEEFIRELFTAEAGFWTLVENDIMPEMDGLPATSKALAVMYPVATETETPLTLESTDELERIFADYISYKKSVKTMEQYVAECENKIKVLMGENALCQIGDHHAKWTNIPGRESVDVKRLAQEMPDVFAKYKTVGKPSRRFSMR